MAVITDELVRDEVRGWLADNWDPDLTLAEWWARLCDSGWGVPTWPEEWFGKGLPRDLAGVVTEELRAAGAIGPPSGLGVLLAGPTILVHGSDEQRARYLRPILNGQEAWCQLFSEPGAGSDLASLQCRAERDGDEWIINGQKVWTSGGQTADLGMLLARTDPDAPKHKGISYFAINMEQPGVEVRPLREMTGRSLFSEVFFSDARAHESEVIGELNGGRVGDLASGKGRDRAQRAVAGRQSNVLERLAKEVGRNEDPTVRQRLAELHILNEVGRYTALRVKAAKASGRGPGPEANTAKLLMSRITRLSRDLGLEILGPNGMLTGSDTPGGGVAQEMALFAPAVSIYGGSDEVQKNIIGERILGLPKEPDADKTKTLPFRELKVGTQRAAG